MHKKNRGQRGPCSLGFEELICFLVACSVHAGGVETESAHVGVAIAIRVHLILQGVATVGAAAGADIDMGNRLSSRSGVGSAGDGEVVMVFAAAVGIDDHDLTQ